MKIYREMVSELDGGGARYSQDLSEVDLSDLEDVKVRVNDPAGDVQVHLGSSDYLRRYRIYVTHAQAWRQQFQKLESVDLRYDNQIIVNPDMERTAKVTALSPAAARTAAAAGVKPAALLTRIGPHEHAIPKPAFELTAKKLDPKKIDPKAATVGPKKKTLVKARAKKMVKPGRNSATAKKVAPKAMPAPATAKKFSGGQKPSPGVVKAQTTPGAGL
jgi:cell division protein FtsQ